jgi:fructoselysine-6-P-deglycase FrlB-like protein
MWHQLILSSGFHVAGTKMQGEGKRQVEAEMARQHDDALQSFHANAALATSIATSIRRTGQVALLGMGGSHWVNRTASFVYRAMGIEVQTEVLSEALMQPLPDHPRTVILTSQSGGSGEIGRYLETPQRHEERFGLTLNAESRLALGVPSLIGHGGVEKAFAATRSILISQALHLSVLAALGHDAGEALAVLENPPHADIRAAFETLKSSEIMLLSGRGVLQGVAENGALCLMELARMPTYAFEGGQFRHGPMELLSNKAGVILLRPPGPASMLTAALAVSCREAGCAVAIIDLSGDPPVDQVVTLHLPPGEGFAASFSALPILQKLLIAIAETKVEALGIPVRSAKVTTVL